MRILSPTALLYLVIGTLWGLGSALVTLDTIRNLTVGTDGYRERITELGEVRVEDARQVVLLENGRGGGDEERGEVEDVSFFFVISAEREKFLLF